MELKNRVGQTPDSGECRCHGENILNQVMHEQIKRIIVDVLALEHLSWDEIGDEQDLFGPGLGLTSIDALELDVALRKTFDLHVPSDLLEINAYFRSVSTLVDYVKRFR